MWGLLRETVERSCADAGVRLIEEMFGGERSRGEIECGESPSGKRASVVVGVKWACVPTIVSTDTPTSALSAIYTDDGVYEEYILVELGLGGADRDDPMPVATAATVPSETIHNLPFAVDAEAAPSAQFVALCATKCALDLVAAADPASFSAAVRQTHRAPIRTEQPA